MHLAETSRASRSLQIGASFFSLLQVALMKWNFSGWAFLFLCAFGVSQNAQAAVMSGSAYEPFNYPDGTQIVIANNLYAGVGWNATGNVNAPNDFSTRWALNGTALPNSGGTGPAKTIKYPSLSYTATGYPPSKAGKATIDAQINNPPTAAGQTNNVSRNMGQLVDSGTFWFSYLTDRNVDTHRTTSLAFFGPANGMAGTPGNTAERVSIGQLGTGTAGNVNSMGNFVFLVNNQNPASVVQSATPINYGTDLTHLVVGKVQFDNGAAHASGIFDTITVWVDPTDVTSEAALGTANLMTSAFELTSFNSIRLFAGNQAAAVDGAPIKNPVSTNFDEIRIGGTLRDAIGTIPEPASLASAVVGMLLLGSQLRRRQAI